MLGVDWAMLGACWAVFGLFVGPIFGHLQAMSTIFWDKKSPPKVHDLPRLGHVGCMRRFCCKKKCVSGGHVFDAAQVRLGVNFAVWTRAGPMSGACWACSATKP